MTVYKIKFQIGDWSGDGHSKHKDFIVSSNKKTEDVREAYFQAVKATKYDFAEKICSEYDDYKISSNQMAELQEIGIKLESSEDDIFLSPESYLDLFFQYLKLGDPDLSLTVQEETLETFHFYGSDTQNRHIPFLGYGLFE